MAKVKELFPEPKKLGSGEEALEALEKALIKAWDWLDDTIIESCRAWRVFGGGEMRLLRQGGWHTTY